MSQRYRIIILIDDSDNSSEELLHMFKQKLDTVMSKREQDMMRIETILEEPPDAQR